MFNTDGGNKWACRRVEIMYSFSYLSLVGCVAGFRWPVSQPFFGIGRTSYRLLFAGHDDAELVGVEIAARYVGDGVGRHSGYGLEFAAEIAVGDGGG